MNSLLELEPPVRGPEPTVTVGFSRRLRPEHIAIAIPLIVGGVLAAIELGTRSLWLDEGSTIAIVSQHGAALWRGIAHDGGNMLAYYLLMHVVIAWFGHALWVLRLPSVIANALTGGLVAALALRLFDDRRVATAAGLLTVVSLPLVFWGQNARGYALLVTLTVGSFLALVAILQTPPGRATGRGAVAAYVLTTLAALYVGYDMALVIPAQLALLLVYRDRARVVIGCLLAVGVLCLPLLVFAAERGSGQLFWVGPLNWEVAQQALGMVLSTAMSPNFNSTPTTVLATIVMGCAVLAAIVVAAREALAAPGRSASLPLLVVICWALVPTALTVAVYAAGEPIELGRVTILVIPALALLLAWLILHPGVAPALGIAGVAVLLVLRLLQLAPSYGVSPEPWKAVTSYVLSATPAERPACVAFYPQDGRESFDYYVTTRASADSDLAGADPAGADPAGADPAPSLTPVLPSLAWNGVKPYVEDYATLDAGRQAAIAGECPRLWLIESHGGQIQGTPQSRRNLERFRSLERDLLSRYPHNSLRSFGWASPIHVRLLWR